MKFLESITWMDNSVLIPINRIKHVVMLSTDEGFVIKITSDDGDWEEHFTTDIPEYEKKLYERYRNIKEIIEAN